MYVFRVEPPVTREASWQIRTVEDLTFTAPDLGTLRQWIREGRLHPDDQVSRTGKNWLRLGDMPEFSEVFRGFGGLPEVFVEMASEGTSAIDELGPPPSFGTEADGAPVEAVVPAPSEVIAVPVGADGPDSGRVTKLAADTDGVPTPIEAGSPWDDSAPADEPGIAEEPGEADDTRVSPSALRPVGHVESGPEPVAGAVEAAVDDESYEHAVVAAEIAASEDEAAGAGDETKVERGPEPDDVDAGDAEEDAEEAFARQLEQQLASSVHDEVDEDDEPEHDYGQDLRQSDDAGRIAVAIPSADELEEVEEVEATLLKPTGAGNTAVVRHAEIADAAAEARRELAIEAAAAPLPIPRRNSSRPHAVADAEADPDEPPPASMLDAVTAHVKPITRAAVESPARSKPADKSPEPADDGAAPAKLVRAETSSASGSSLSRAAAARRSPAPKEVGRSRSWPLYAGLGLVVGVAIVFGIPDIRNQVLGWAGVVVGDPEPVVNEPLVTARTKTEAAIRELDPAAMDAQQGALADAVKAAADDETAARMELLQTELVAAAVFEARIKGAIAVHAARVAGEPIPAVGDASSQAAQRLEAAVQALPAVGGRANDPVATARAEVRAAIARAVVPRSLAALGQDAVATELQLLAIAGPWLSEPTAKVPSGLIGELAQLPSPSATSSLLLALAYWRAGDEQRALSEAEALSARVAKQPTAAALVAAVQRTAKPGALQTGDDGGAAVADAGAASGGEPAGDAGASTGTGGPVGADSPADGAADGPADDGGTTDDGDEPVVLEGGNPPTPRLSTDGLIERGCNKVDAGDAKAGVELLKRAFERRPRDIDALTCLGNGYAKLGRTSSGLTYYERALDVNARFKPALVGAAKMCAKLSRTKQAVRYYKRVLDIEPGNAKAKSYVEANDGPKPPAETAAPAETPKAPPAPKPDDGAADAGG